MKPISVLIFLIFTTNSFSQTPPKYYFSTWCSKMENYQLKNHLRDAAQFVGLEGGVELLTIGMMSEGVAIKSKEEKIPENALKNLNQQNFFLAQDLLPKEKFKLPPTTWYLKGSDENYAKNIGIIMAHNSYYGDSWTEDGTDTFGLEYYCLRKRGLIPIEFTSGPADSLSALPLDKHPDFAFGTLTNERSLRFAPSSTYNSEGVKTNCQQDLVGSSNFKEKMSNMEVRDGDPGHTFYRTAESQVFANAAMWKLAQERMYGFKKELNITRDFTPDEILFWSKAFFNGGQGTQAGVFKMMNLYHSKGFLKNQDYLHTYPGDGSQEIYNNARIVLETIKQTPKECFEKIPPASGKSYTKITELTPHKPLPVPVDNTRVAPKKVIQGLSQ
jgi:hypothetical protein